MLDSVISIGAGGVGEGDGAAWRVRAGDGLEVEAEDTRSGSFDGETKEFDFAYLNAVVGKLTFGKNETVALVS